MTFSHQILAYLAPAVFALALLAYAANRKRKAADLKKFAGKGLFSNASNFKTAFKALLLALGAGSIVFALARPKWGYKWEELTQKGVDIVFAVDTSKSMLAEDLKPNRLERAKLAISDIVDRLKGDRIGLVAFSGQAFLQCPITLDYDAFKMSLDALDTNIIQRGGTNIASALDEAAAALKSTAAEKIIVLISDGEELEASAARKAEEIAKIKGVKIYTLGVGSAKGEPIPVRDEKGGQTLLRDESGKLVSSRLNEKILTDVAKAAGGFYANMANNGMEQIYEEGIEKAQKSDISSKMKKTAVERFQIPLAAALIFLALELLIGTRKIFAKRGLNNSALALAAIIAAGTMHPKDGEASETPPSWTDSYNAGVENFQKGEISKAKDDFYKSIASTQDFSKQADSYYNIGCADYAAAKAAFGKIEKPEQILPEFKNALKQASESLSSGSETLKKGKAALQKGEEFLKEKNLQNEIKQSISACEESKKSLEKSAKSGAETEPKIKGAAAAADSALANF
ncbi:MAG: VWA domain-containing protein, partial [Opitutales bacterium]|nr:VWA domain-containing protein [Opitutales bacterium]